MLLDLLRRFLRPYRPLVAGVLAFQFVGTMAALYLPSLNADIIDHGVSRGDTHYILRTGAWMLAVSVVQIVCSIAAVYFGGRTAMSFGRDVRGAIFDRVGRFSAREMAQFGAPSLITRNTNDVQQVQMLVVMSATMMAAAPIMCVGGIVMAVRQDVGLSWILAVSVPLLFVLIGLVVSRMVPQFRAVQERLDDLNRVLREQITGVRVVRAFVRERVEERRFQTGNEALTDSSMRAGRWLATMFPVVMIVVNASSVAVIWAGASRVDSGAIQVGSLTAYLSYLMQILMSIMMASFMLMMVPRAAVCAERIGEVLATESSLTPPADPLTEVTGRAEVEFDSVTFRYPGAAAPVLRDVTLRLTPGTTTAVIGSTGAGKTTLVSLVPRLLDPTEGAVRVDGIDVRDLHPNALSERIGYVPQQSFLFSGTVASNLRYGRPEATEDELWQALDTAQARDFVAALPNGLESRVAQGGTNLSGGQRQRLAIARALVRRPEIYLFDDALSALDLGTDARLRAALRPLTRDCAVLIVAQRVSSVVDADQIVVLDAGAVVGIGRHDELLATCPTYAEIVSSQLSAAEAAA